MSKYVGGDEGMRAVAIRALHSALSKAADQRLPVSTLTRLLCTDNDAHTVSICEQHGLQCEVDDEGRVMRLFYFLTFLK